MDDRGELHWRGKVVREMSKEELVEAVWHLSLELESAWESNRRWARHCDEMSARQKQKGFLGPWLLGGS